ncbi:MAG: hypothetical protein JNL26_05505 [Gemmatimonadetes bacterium]|nr:hypothetical protein [Gemmatimonadota bacterium]
MSRTPAPASPVRPPIVELRLLGGASLLSEDGGTPAGRARHRHRLALLARLALAAPGGLTRDKLLGLLWPERDEASARHLLRAALYEVRNALGAAVLSTVGNDVRLDASQLYVDVQDFEACVARGELERAVALYRGPFLDGFHLDEAEAFDEWMSAERLRLAGVYERTLEQLAEGAATRGDSAAAARWWRRLATAKPADGRVALNLMDALVAEGDPAGALAHAAAHTEWLRTELGVGPDAALVRRVTALRRGMPVGEPVAAVTPAVEAALVDGGTTAAPEVPGPEPAALVPALAANDRAPDLVKEPVGRPGRRWLRWGAGLAAVVVLVVAMVRGGVGVTTSPLRVGSDGAPSVIAVAPFTLVGDVAPHLREGLATLLTANLDQVAELRLVPATQVAASFATARSGTAEKELMRAVRAEFLVNGTVVAAPEGIAITTRITDRDGGVRASIEVRGPVTDLAALIDRISLSFLRELWGRRWGVPKPRLAAVATESPAALRAYLRGEMFLRAALWDSAAAALAEAVDDDSTFALAHMRLAEPYGWRYGMSSTPAQRTLATADRLADRLPPRERMLLRVRRLHEAGSFAALDSATALAERYADDAEAQYVRADVRFHAMDALGLQMIARAASAFDTAMTLDSASARVFAHPLTLSLVLGDSVRFDRTAARLEALGGGSHMNVAERWDYALLRRVRFSPAGDAVRALTSRLRAAPPASWQVTDLLPAAERAVYGARNPEPQLVFALHDALRSAYGAEPALVTAIDGMRASVLIGIGRMNAAREWMGRMTEAFPNGAPVTAITPVVFGYAPPEWLDDMRRQMTSNSYWQSTPTLRRTGVYWRGIMALLSGDTGGARTSFAEAAAKGPAGDPGDTASHGLATALRAANGWVRYVEGDTVAGLRDVEEGLHDGGYDGEAMLLNRPTRIWFTRLQARSPARRAEAIDRMRGELLRAEGYRLAWWRLELSRALEASGDLRGAAEERRRFEALWANADPAARASALANPSGATTVAPAGRVP